MQEIPSAASLASHYSVGTISSSGKLLWAQFHWSCLTRMKLWPKLGPVPLVGRIQHSCPAVCSNVVWQRSQMRMYPEKKGRIFFGFLFGFFCRVVFSCFSRELLQKTAAINRHFSSLLQLDGKHVMFYFFTADCGMVIWKGSYWIVCCGNHLTVNAVLNGTVP